MGYKSKLGLLETEKAIKSLKDFFQKKLSDKLNLIRVSAPLFVKTETGLNDNLNGVELPVSFVTKSGEKVEIVQSLAKWKRVALYRYGIPSDQGIYADMNAIRKDEDMDSTHSIYVDQWDWEKIIVKEDRTEEKLKEIVRNIYEAFRETDEYAVSLYPVLSKKLPSEITFITAQELEDKYPGKSPKEREDLAAKEFGAYFLMKIGGKLNSGERHDGRAPDYDDWELNGDIIFYYEPLERALELSSMGIRVDEDSLERQLKLANCENRKEFEYHQMILNKKLPYTVGGGIGQSRICMFFLEKLHIGEVQASIWDEKTEKMCEDLNIDLL